MPLLQKFRTGSHNQHLPRRLDHPCRSRSRNASGTLPIYSLVSTAVPGTARNAPWNSTRAGAGPLTLHSAHVCRLTSHDSRHDTRVTCKKRPDLGCGMPRTRLGAHGSVHRLIGERKLLTIANGSYSYVIIRTPPYSYALQLIGVMSVVRSNESALGRCEPGGGARLRARALAGARGPPCPCLSRARRAGDHVWLTHVRKALHAGGWARGGGHAPIGVRAACSAGGEPDSRRKTSGQWRARPEGAPSARHICSG